MIETFLKNLSDLRRAGRKGLAFSVVVGVILAMIGSSTLLAVYGESFSQSKVFCGLYSSLSVIHPAFENMKPDQCDQNPDDDGDVLIGSNDETAAAQEFVSYISDCWNSNKNYGNISQRCYLISFPNLQNDIKPEGGNTKGEIEPAELNAVLDDAGISYDVCGSLISSPCGSRPYLEWKYSNDKIKSEALVQIKYLNRTIVIS